MKKFKLSIITAIAVTGIIATNATAATVGVSNNNVALVTQIVKSKNIDKMVSRANALDSYAEQYILLTGHIPSNINDIQSKFALSNDSIANFSGAPLNISVDTNNYKITVKHLFNRDIDSNTLSLLDNSSALAPTASISDNQSGEEYNPAIVYPMSSNLINFVINIKAINADPNSYISVNAPSDISKTWYKPTGDGHFYVYKYADGNWKNSGSLSNLGIVAKSVADLDQYDSIAKVGTKAYVASGNEMDEYIYDGKEWKRVSSNGAGTLFNGTATVFDLTTDLFSKAGGSIATVAAPDKEWIGSKDFIKKDDTRTGGFWIDKDNKRYIATASVKNLEILDDLFVNGTYAFIPNSSKTAVLLMKKTYVPGVGVMWVYVANDLKDAIRFLNAPKTADDLEGEYVYVKDKNVFLKRGINNKVLEPVTGKYFISSDGREDFTNPSSGFTYLTAINDCSIDTCYSNGAYKIDGLTTFYYAPSAEKNINGLTDAVSCGVEGAEDVDDKCFKYSLFMTSNGKIWTPKSYIANHTKYCKAAHGIWGTEGSNVRYFYGGEKLITNYPFESWGKGYNYPTFINFIEGRILIGHRICYTSDWGWGSSCEDCVVSRYTTFGRYQYILDDGDHGFEEGYRIYAKCYHTETVPSCPVTGSSTWYK